MNDDDKKEVERLLERWLCSDEVQQVIRKVISHVDTEKYIKRSEQWLDRLPFLMIGLAIGVIAALIMSGHH